MKPMYRKFNQEYMRKLDTLYQIFNKTEPIRSLEIRKAIKLYGFVNYWAKKEKMNNFKKFITSC